MLAWAAAERAKLAADETDIREIDVSIHHIGDDVSRQFAAQHIGSDQQTEQIIAFGKCQSQPALPVENAALLQFKHPLDTSPHLGLNLRSNVGPFQSGEIFEFRLRTDSRSHCLSLSEVRSFSAASVA
jgi:hypothetical protein